MNKFNRKFNSHRKRQELWFKYVTKLADFDGLVNDHDGATPEDVRVIKTIHKKLYECYVMAQERLKEARK